MDSNPLNWTKNTSPKSFINPLEDDIIVEYRHENNLIDNIRIPGMRISTHPTYIADVLVKHVVDEIINKRDLGNITPEKRKELEAEVLI